MRKLLALTGAAALLAASSFAALADFENRATITAIDPATGTVTLDSGVTLTLPEGYDAAQLPVGQLIDFDYDPATLQIDSLEVVTDGDVMSDTEDSGE